MDLPWRLKANQPLPGAKGNTSVAPRPGPELAGHGLDCPDRWPARGVGTGGVCPAEPSSATAGAPARALATERLDRDCCWPPAAGPGASLDAGGAEEPALGCGKRTTRGNWRPPPEDGMTAVKVGGPSTPAPACVGVAAPLLRLCAPRSPTACCPCRLCGSKWPVLAAWAAHMWAATDGTILWRRLIQSVSIIGGAAGSAWPYRGRSGSDGSLMPGWAASGPGLEPCTGLGPGRPMRGPRAPREGVCTDGRGGGGWMRSAFIPLPGTRVHSARGEVLSGVWKAMPLDGSWDGGVTVRGWVAVP
mmetsp:Transcript_23337/g.78448  ORF Transcript_23337/g.78448 Transcript_23337/m.78448 type:complete len:303 (-) Transcript_23337:1119-2027(-)